MPIGNVSRDSGPKRDNYRPPWVKDKDTEAPPPWTQKKLKPVEAKTSEASEDAPATSAKSVKPGLKKQSTIREKAENGVTQPSEEKVVKPSGTKLQERSKAAEERASKFTKSALKSIETIPKLEDKLALQDKNSEKGNEKVVEKPAVKLEKPTAKTENVIEKADKTTKKVEKPIERINKIVEKTEKVDKAPEKNEKPVLRSVRTIDDKAKEKSVTIVDKRSEKNGPNKLNNAVSDKPLNKPSNERPFSKTKTIDTEKSAEKSSNKNNSEKPALKTVTTNDKSNSIPNDKSLNKTSNSTNDKTPIKTTTVIDKGNDKNKDSKEEKGIKVVLKPVPKVDKVIVEESPEKKTEMATKPPTPLEKTSKLPPRKPSIQKQPSKDEIGSVKKWRDPLHERVKENIDKTLANEIPKGHTLTKNESLRSLLKPTPPPMPPPMPPKMPPPPEFKKNPLDPTKLKKIEQLRSRPRRRPDWSDMMKEVEQGKKLKKVVCNDRSSPIITRTSVVKNKDQFIFESEKPNSHNELLKEINKGVRLKKVKTNDRSKPNLEGLRKFRRQMTIEEQVQKSMSQANLAASPSGVALAEAPAPAEEEEIDEMDDIDKVRDDLQSTKQLLAIELRNKEAQERENKRLLTRIQNLEAELARERAIIRQEQHKTVISVTDAYDERLVNSLKMEVEKTKENADNLEKQYLDAAEQRDSALTELEEMKRKNAELEKKLELALSNNLDQLSLSEEPLSFYQKRQLDFEKQCRLLNIDVNSDEAHSLRKSAANNNLAYNASVTNYDYGTYEGIMPTNVGSRRSSHAIKSQLSVTKDDSFEEESESEEEEEESEEKKQKRMEKEVRNMRNKISHLKQKQDNMKRERMAYKMSLKNQQAALKDEKRKYKELKREVDKMAAMMKEVGSDDEDDDDEEEEESSEEQKSESEEETETETEQDTESETESESEPEDAPLPKKKDNLTKRVKRHETRVNALKKGNALLQANVDRLKDDVLKQREESMTLQKELDSLIDDLE